MTREEFEQYAIDNGLVVWSNEMSERAIKALEQEPKTDEDCISRRSVLDIDFNRICLTMAKPAEMIRNRIKDLPSVQPKTEQEIREELNRLSTYRVPNSNTDLVSRKAVERVLNLVFRGCRNKEPKTDTLDKIRAEIHENAEMQSDGEWYLNEKWIFQIIDKYKEERE